MQYDLKRSNEPVSWALFGAGGMFGAIFAPVIILVMLLLPAFGVEAGQKFAAMVFGSAIGKLFMLCMIVLPLWCGLHRIHHCLHDLKIHTISVKRLCLGLAVLLSLLAVCLIFAI